MDQQFHPLPGFSCPADDLDFVAHPRHMEMVVQKVQEKLTGKEEVIFDLEEVKNGKTKS